MLTYTVLLLLLSVIAQLGAALLALRQWPRLAGHRLAWTCLTLALILMVPQRVAPLELALATGLYDYSAALFDCAVSLLMLAALWGLRHLFAALTRQRGR